MKLKINKKLFYKIHTWIGIKMSILFFIVCFSGTLATLSHEMDWLFIPEMRATTQKEFASRNLIISNLKKEYPKGKLTYWMRQVEPYLCDILYIVENGKRRYVFANQYTGEIQGYANITFQRFFRDLHYFLFIPNQVGNFIVLFFGFLLLISLITALCFYKKWWKKLFILQTGKGALVFFKSLHKLIGLWSLPFTILFSITGIWYFIERADIGDIRAEINPRSPKITQFDAKIDSTLNLSYEIDYDRILKISKEAIPNLKVEGLNPAITYKNTVYVRGTSDVPLVRQRANRVYINPNTYEVIKIQNANDISAIMWINDIADPLHFGYWGGLTTKIIWFITGLGISSLVLTGIWITLKRKAIRNKKDRGKVFRVWKYVNWGTFIIMMYFLNDRLTNVYFVEFYIKLLIYFLWLIVVLIAYFLFEVRVQKAVRESN